jgi:hypothetical protein
MTIAAILALAVGALAAGAYAYLVYSPKPQMPSDALLVHRGGKLLGDDFLDGAILARSQHALIGKELVKGLLAHAAFPFRDSCLHGSRPPGLTRRSLISPATASGLSMTRMVGITSSQRKPGRKLPRGSAKSPWRNR